MRTKLITIYFLLISVITFSQRSFEPDNDIYTVVDSMPSFGSSENDLQDYIQSHSKIPTSRQRSKTSTPVFVKIIIEQDGIATFVEIARGDGGKLDNTAKKVIKKMPKWNPGSHKGVPKRVSYIIPFWFTP